MSLCSVIRQARDGDGILKKQVLFEHLHVKTNNLGY